MESTILSIFSASVLLYAVVVAILILIIRRSVEAFFKKAFAAISFTDKYEDKIIFIWKEWVLRVLPMVVGGLLAYFLSSYPFPEEFAASDSGRTILGIIAGLFSSQVYGFVKVHVEKYLPKNIKEKVEQLEEEANQ